MGTPYGVLVNMKQTGSHFTVRKKKFLKVTIPEPKE